MLVMSAANKVGEGTIERFAEILEWFGPFTANGKTFLSNIKKITRLPYAFFFVLLLRSLFSSLPTLSRAIFSSFSSFPSSSFSSSSQRGFFGDDFKDQKALANLMAGKEVGSYMVRFSSQVGSYTITSMVRPPRPPPPRARHASRW